MNAFQYGNISLNLSFRMLHQTKTSPSMSFLKKNGIVRVAWVKDVKVNHFSLLSKNYKRANHFKDAYQRFSALQTEQKQRPKLCDKFHFDENGFYVTWNKSTPNEITIYAKCMTYIKMHEWACKRVICTLCYAIHFTSNAMKIVWNKTSWRNWF